MTESIDDPYKILALNLVSKCTNGELSRMLHDTKVIKRRVAREVNSVDFCGDFLDCVMVKLVKTGRARKIGKTMTATVDFFYQELDIKRLREEIKRYCLLYNRDVE